MIIGNNKKSGTAAAVLWLMAASLLAVNGVALAVGEGALMDEYTKLSDNPATPGTEWFEFAIKARGADQPEIAAEALDRAAAAGVSPVRIGVEKARQFVAMGEPASAVNELRNLFGQGFTAVGFLTNDPVINTLQGHPEYDALIKEMSVEAYPCEHQAGFRDFDFWVGDWDVHTADGQLAGSNSITREERGCVLVERWSSASGGTGMSINYLDKTSDEWVQVWNAEGGAQINIRGGLTDEGMALEGMIHYVGNGTTAPFRGLWTPLPDGRVRQYFEQSNDDGKTWTPWFEGFYTRTGQ